MSTNESMTKRQLDAIKARADSVTTTRRAMPGDWQRRALLLSEDVDALVAEVERLRALITVPGVMMERVARAIHAEDETLGTPSWDDESEMDRGDYRRMARAALDAVLGVKEEV